MNLRSALLAALLIGALVSAPLAAVPRWTALGPDGGSVNNLTVDPVDARVLYATLDGQHTFKSVDGGTTWSLIHTGVASGSVAVDPFRHTTIYQTFSSNEVLKSTDGGATWTTSSRQSRASLLAVDPAKRNRIYLAADGVWRSFDGGVTWKRGRKPLPSGAARFVNALAVPRRPADTVYAATADGVFKSQNGGESWQRASRGLPPGPVTALALAPANPKILWANVYNSGVFRSSDGGTSWRSTPSQPTAFPQVSALAVDPENPAQAWVGTVAEGIYRTSDAGTHWAAVGPHPSTLVNAIEVTSTSLYAGVAQGFRYPGGVLASGDGGTTWQMRNAGLIALLTFDLAIDPHHPEILWAAAAEAGLYRSTVGGRVWDFPTQPPVFPSSLAVRSTTFSADGAILYVASDGRLWSSDNAGVSWRLVLGPETTPATTVSSLLTYPLDAATLYAGYPGGSQRFFASHDSGATWQALEPGFDCFLGILAVAPSAPATLYAGGAAMNSASPSFRCRIPRAALFRSTDGGATWTKADSGLTGETVLSLVVDPFDSRILYATSGGISLPRVSKSLDGGTTWFGLSSPFMVNLVFSAGGGTLWGSQGSEVFASRDGGASWQSVGGPQGSGVVRLIPDPTDPGRLYAATSGGIWVLEDEP
jgi:photosystem II stability/assembly factor-like uncharacterized protein